MRRLIPIILLAAVLSGCAAAEQETASPKPGAFMITREEALSEMNDIEAVDFSLEDINGNTVSLKDYRGKIIFLNFWQTWCPPCRDEMPLFEQITQENDDLVVLAVAPLAGERAVSKEKAETGVRDFVNSNSYTFPVLIEPAEDGGISQNELYAAPYVPANYVIDREGILRLAIEGAYSKDLIDLVLVYMRALDE